MRRSTYIILAGVMALSVQSIFAQADTLTIDQCTAIALKNNPQLKIAEGTRDFNSSSVVSTRSALFPQLSFQTGWTKNGGTTIVGKNEFNGNIENYSTGFSAQQLIFDFGKTYSRLNASSYTADAAQQDYISAKQSLLLSVHSAYYTYLQSIRMRDVNAELLKQAEDHLVQAKGFYEVGRKPQFDVMKAETDLANAKLNMIKANNTVRLSKIQLENVLNQKLPDNFSVRDNLDIQQDAISLQDAYETAFSNRPEIFSGKSRVEASRSLLTTAWTSNLPSISANGGYNWKGFTLDEKLNPSWNLGLTLSLPLFQGFALDAGIDQARANVKIAESQNDAIVQAVKLDIEQQYSNLKEASERIDASKFLVTQAEETYRLAEGRYKQEVGSPIEVTDAEATLLNAKTSYIQALYDFNVTRVRLQRAMGTLK